MDSQPQVDPRIGLVLNGRYRVDSMLGEGGMGVVYRGQRLQLDRPVAIKFLHSPYAGSPKFVARFDREARAMSRLSHPCCVSVIDFGVQDAPYIVMDFAPGDTLRTILDEQRLTATRSVQITRQILTGLAHAHEQGIVHRDIKPGNIMLGEATGMGDHVRIFDFGLAKLHDPSGLGDPSTTGVIGTPSYMAPEQTRGDKLDLRVDLYATGVVLFELLTGEKPFDAPDTLAVLRMHREKHAPRVSDRGSKVSHELEAVVAKALQKEPDDRYQTAAEFLAALDAVPEATGKASTERVTEELALAPTVAERALRISPSRGDSTAGTPVARGGSTLSLVTTLAILAVLAAVAWTERHSLLGLLPGTPAPVASHTPAAPETTAAPAVAAPEVAAPEVAAPDVAALDGAVQEVKEGDPAPEPVAPAVGPEAGTWAASDAGLFEITEEDLAAADLALDDPTDSEAAPPANEASNVSSVKDVRALIAQGKVDDAIAGLRVLRRRDPRNPELPYLIGDLYFEKGFFKDGLSRYRQALKLRPSMKVRATVQRNAIAALGNDKTYARARALIVSDLGPSAIERLRTAQKRDPSRVVRQRAKSVLAQLASPRR